MPDTRDRREILFYEAAEGGAGVLRQLAEDPSVLPALARRALEVCHYSPDSLEDQAADWCGKACYQCLLDYANQPDHKDLDRALIRDPPCDRGTVGVSTSRRRGYSRRPLERVAKALRQQT